jgi:hypothetical protein
MKFRVAFFFSQAENELGFRFWRWKWHLPLDKKFSFKGELFKREDESEDKKSKNDGQPKKDKKSKDSVSKFLVKALLYPETRNRIWKFAKKLTCRIYNLFSVKFENIEVKGTLGDPFYDSMALGIFRGCYYPHWENENEKWSAKGEVILRTGFFRWFSFLLGSIYETATLAFIVWCGLRRAKKAAQ